jgi:hypothetical protein
MEFFFRFLVGLSAMLLAGAAGVWIAWKFLKRSENPGSLVVKWIITIVAFIFVITVVAGWGVMAPGIGAAIGIILGIIWAPSFASLISGPLTSLYTGGNAEPEDRPFYSIARAHQKQGRHPQAIAEVRDQLRRFPEDYEGWMLLAEINADLKDNAAAQQCLAELFLHKQKHSDKNLVFALNRSADWHLALALDRNAARAALEKIQQDFPDTEYALNAAQRIAHLITDKMLAEQKERPRISLIRHEGYAGLRGETVSLEKPAEDPARKASELVDHLNEHPFDAATREALALIYADHYGRLELASDQIEQLISAPGASQKNVAHYLNLLADLHIRVLQSQAGAEAALRRIIELFPNTAAASNAEKRIGYISTELKGKTKSQVLQLGSYERDIGLKGQVPRKQ